MGINLRLSSSANGTRNAGPLNMGGGANLVERSLFSSNTPNLAYSAWNTPGNGSPAISSSDYYLMSGLYRALPYDLDTMGSDGATIKAREGMRYVWMIWGDHQGNWIGSVNLMVGYSNDPQIWPEPTTLRTLHNLNTFKNVTDQLGQTQNSIMCYWYPTLVYNPDTPNAAVPSDKFYIYCEGQSLSSARNHELMLITTPDFLTSTFVGPAICTTNNDGWGAPGIPTRLGANSWEAFSLGRTDAVGGVLAKPFKYTSTDGWVWTPDYATQVAGVGPYVTISGQKYMVTLENGDPNSFVSLLAVNSSNVSLGTYTRLSTGYGSNGNNATTSYPGPTYLQNVDAYEEDGVATINAIRGFPISSHDGTNPGPFLNNFPSFYSIVGSITSGVLNVTTWPAGNPPLAVGFTLGGAGAHRITSFGTGTGGVGTYNLANTFDQPPGTTFTVLTNGGLWHQFIDQYYLITNPSTAANAAPLGVKAKCVSSTVTVSWNNCLPNNTYRVYRGTTVGTQATLIGTITGTSITDTPTVGSQYFYKVVTMNSGVEQKSRVVSVYCSNNVEIVNKHVNRVINDGGDTSKIDMTFLASAASWLTSNDCWRYVNWWVDARFGIKIDGSGFISKVYCLGTTYLPRGGDYTPTTSNTFPSTSSNTSYSATSFRGTTPSWINNASTARGFFGNGRCNNIQRWSEITLLAAYQKPGTAVASLFGYGQNQGLYLTHNSGSSGNVVFGMVDNKAGAPTTFQTATVPFASATAAHVAAAVFDNANMTAYLDGTPGTPVACSNAVNTSALTVDTTLRGTFSSDASSISDSQVLGSGTANPRFIFSSKTYSMGNSEALFTGAGLAVFNKGFSQSLIQSWGAMYA